MTTTATATSRHAAERPVALATGRLTALEPDPRRTGAVRLFIDGRHACTVGAAAVAGLAIGTEVDAPLAARLEAAADSEAALRLVLRHLARRAFARHDLGRRLVQKGQRREPVEAALDEAARLGLLDDARFARDYAEARLRRGRGPVRVAAELGHMGVDRALIDAAIADLGPSADDLTMPRRLAERRLAQLRGLPPAARRRRVLAFLHRRGFASAAVVQLVGRLLADEREAS